MKKILAYVSPERQPSFFDVIVGFDSGADAVVPYGQVDEDGIREIVYSATFTRHPEDLENTAIFIGGHDIDRCWDLMSALEKTLSDLPTGRKVSFTMDPDGAYTTASACVVKVKSALGGDLRGKTATVLAGTGPVGQIIATLLFREGCKVNITSRSKERADLAASVLKKRYHANITPLEAGTPSEMEAAVGGSEVVVSAGPEGIMLLPEDVWSSLDVRVLADVNAVPPYGIEGVDPMLDCGSVGEDVVGIGALAIGRLKMRTHHELVRRLFVEKGVAFDLGKVYSIAESV